MGAAEVPGNPRGRGGWSVRPACFPETLAVEAMIPLPRKPWRAARRRGSSGETLRLRGV